MCRFEHTTPSWRLWRGEVGFIEEFIGAFRIKFLLQGFKSFGRGRRKDGGYGVWMPRGVAVDEDGGEGMEMEMQTVVRDQGAGDEGVVEGKDGDAIGVEGVELEDLTDRLMNAKNCS
jgi:hypothetical protein